MRLITLTFLALAASAAAVWQLPCAAAESEGTEAKAEVYQTWPFDDAEAKRRQEETAKRLGIPVESTLDLGGGVKLELVLIPAGKFVMGTPEPESPLIGGTILGTAGLLALILLAVLVVRAIRQRRWPQFSLRWLILLVALLGVAQYGGFRWWRAVEALRNLGFDESPAHEVSLSTPYYMGKYEVTQEQYQQVTGTKSSYFKRRDLPVENVSWNDAQEFCRKLSERTGREVRLPTEAEWEYACRGGTQTRYSFGDENGDLYRFGNYCDKSNRNGFTWQDKEHDDGQDKTAPVGSYKPNGFGVYDMHGNVWEWCGDWYGEYVKGAQRDPTGEADGAGRVLRGGSWTCDPRVCRSACRNWRPPGRHSDFGFRVVVVARTP